ncbi:PREDICTED: protein Shroom4 [Corvus brachyrhynchos]|uniref:protein Shroom4 n=1 Tax=Corvus brachyrhynchos TaxID=85066 RepID=UPI0008167936|nr:PREDICTED: protein Shroom4 [Corvus brachyrhynchos]
MGTVPTPAGHCSSQGCQHCTYRLGQRGWPRVSHAGSTMALLPLSTAVQSARFILAMGVREGRHVPGLSTSPTVVSYGHIGRDGILWASKSSRVPRQAQCGVGSSGRGLASTPDKGPLCCLCLRGNLLGWDIFLSPPSPMPLLRNSCDQRRGRAWPRRSLCGAWGSGTFSKAPFSPDTQRLWNIPWDILGAVPPLTPLSVTQVEDGGKAALSRRLQPGDELVNISGTPLYGSRQEALILIKGSYRTLKMIVRRRSVPVLRPHSWHVAKLAESRPDIPTMHCPADAFSLSWPSGCDVSTDRSSSIGSMESLDHPGQAYYEGDPSPVDQGMYHSKRDSAYSSFSASSIASDCALSLRPEEAVSIDSSLQGPCKASDGRYLTTGAEPSVSRHPEAWRAPVPPQPPVRRDSLRPAPAGRGERCQASVSADMLHAKGRWISDTFLCQRDGEVEVVGRRTLASYPTKDRLSADQYYMLSSHPDRCPAEPLLGESMESDNQPYLDDSMHRVPDAMTAGDNPLLSPFKGHMSHRHSAPEQLLASQLRSLQLGTGYCGGDLCPPPLPRGHTCRCHPVPWVRCPDCCCPAPHPGREESDAWPPQRAFVPEFPQDEWEPPAITRKVSQSISELSSYPLGFPRLGPFHTCLESTEPEWPPCYRATSTHDLLWDSDRLAHTTESPLDPLHRPLRGRAFSESHLNLEPASPWGRDRKDHFRAKLDPPSISKKKGPPPPRPPPPNWEKYRQRRASQHPPDGAGHGSAFSAAPVPIRSIAEAVRERSQSLTGEREGQSWGHTARPPAPPGAWPRPEPPRSLRRTPGPDATNAEIFRLSGAGEKRTKMKQSREMEEQPQRLIQNQEQGCASPRGVGECSLSLHCGPGPALPEALKPSSGAVEGVSCQGSRPHTRCMDSEELLWDVAVRDHSLANVLAPLAPPGTATEVMGELLMAGERQAWRKCLQQDWHVEAVAQDRQGFEPISPPPRSAASSSSFPVHYGVAVGKAEPPNKVKVLPEVVEGSLEDEEEVDHELVEKKLQLIESLSRKLVVLQEAQRGLQEDISANGALGEDVAARLQALCTPGEFDKYRLFVGDLDKVINLLLSLSGRLARVETALGSLGPHAPAEDKLALREKQRLLVAQLEDAKELKEHVGRREEAVGAMVARYLPAEQLQDYQHFVKMKSALIAEQRELEEKIKLGQEQLRCLRESLGQASKGC